MSTKIRKTEINLVTLGTGVVLFGAWTFVKVVLSTLLYSDGMFDSMDELGEFRDIAVIITYILIFLAAVIIFLIHFYVGMSARAEGKGKRKTALYPTVTGIIVFFDLLLLAPEAYLLFTGDNTLTYIIITLIIDVTSMVIHLELLINAIAIRRLKKKEAQA